MGGHDGLQDRDSSCNWMPTTPFRPILPKPPVGIPKAARIFDFGSEETESRVFIDLSSPDRGEESGASIESHFKRVAKWKDVPCTDLLVLAEAAGEAVHGNGSGGVMEETKHELPFPNQRSCDLNLPPTTYGQLAPITPDKATRVDREDFSELPNSNADDGRGQDIADQWDSNSATVNIFEQETNKDLAKSVADSSHANHWTELQENHNPDKEVSNSIDLNKTPQQKQRRRKHRPKVVIEGKPKITPKRTGSNEKSSTKRKYVRKNSLNKDSTPTPQEFTEHVDSNKEKPRTRSSRRVLNFDKEEPKDESYTCRSSNLGSQSQAPNFCTNGVQSNTTVPAGNDTELVADSTQVGIDPDLSRSANQILKDPFSLPEQSPSTLPLTRSSSMQAKQFIHSQKGHTTEGQGRVSTHIGHANTAQSMMDCDSRSSPRSPINSNCSTTKVLTQEQQANGAKRKYTNIVEQGDPTARNLIGANYNNFQAYYNLLSWVHFPYIYKKKRTAHSAIPSTSYQATIAENMWRPSTSCYVTPSPQFQASNVSPVLGEAGKDPQQLQAVESILPLYLTERSTKKRTRGPTKVRDLASLIRTPEHILHRACLAKQSPADGNGQRVMHLDRTQTCIDALVTDVGATLAKKKRTKRNPVTSLQRSLIIYKNQPFFASGVPPQATFEQLLSAITEHLRRLDINRENSRFAYQGYNVISSYETQHQEHNSVVLYKRDGTVVPFDGSFDPLKKRKARPKVDLDQETDRVWKLLMDNINSEGIDGTDDEKAKWWEDERSVFQGRADSFIARMHLVQGDRRFSPWKGSVVDSVVGVFLTQNVSDHLSSSAFMSMAAHFPLKSTSKQNACFEEGASFVVDEPELCIGEEGASFVVDEPEVCIGENSNQQPEVCIGENSNKPACDWSSITFYETQHNEENVNGKENSRTTTEGFISRNESACKQSHSSKPDQDMYHNSPVNQSTKVSKWSVEEDSRTTNNVGSSHNSVDSSISQNLEKTGSCGSNSETEDLPNKCENISLDYSTSFVELLRKAESNMLHEVYSHRFSHMPSHDSSNFEGYQNDQRHNTNRGAFLEPSSDCCSHITPNPAVQQVECFDMFREVTPTSDTSENKNDDSLSEKSTVTAESASQDTIHTKLGVNVQEALKHCGKPCNNMLQSQVGDVGNSNTVDILPQEQNKKMQKNGLDSSGDTTNAMQKTAESDLTEQAQSISKEVGKMNSAASKTKNRRAGKEKKKSVDWDKLRIQAEPNGRKREKTAKTQDSLDWEAVRCADVNEIAQTIRERGMNNMLAERIKDFLNRLVREHGSVDLEWLRDVPPDQAKEYLLSFRGLGLKSVECVRLLTLHHLAFPVDTNVGRIAVRLGWVPLQPLPESLQLHLLELYPVLESIQKYLWPRLCKLDQRTLYELHYQMITFGKVFCTKSKPNCNACPMRGECRHFASAFASARLALPGPEEKSIVSATEERSTCPNPAQINNRMPLPAPQATEQLEGNQQLEASQQSEGKSSVGSCEPIIEEPATPEPACTETIDDIEDFYDDPNEIPTIKLNMEEFTQNLQNYMQQNMELQEGEMSKALVSITPEAAAIPTPKLKNVSRLRTEHLVYEIPDVHPLLEMLRMEKREPDDPCNYMLAIWTPGETPNSIQPPEKRCTSQEIGKLCDDMECFSCNSAREANSQMVRGTLLIPCRTAMRGSFPLNGTYFQVNEVFADHDSSLNPIDIPRAWLWNLNRRTVYFGTSIPTIFKGLTTPEIQHCFWRGYVCVRGFDQTTRAPRPLMARLHYPASKLNRSNDRREE